MNNSDSVKPNIVIVGHVVIDHNKTEQSSYVRWGSPAMFIRQYLRSSFAINPTIIASYGEDFLQYASDTLLLPNRPNINQTIVNENIVVNGQRTQYSHGINVPLPEITTDVQAALAKADILFLAPLSPAFAADFVGNIARYLKPECLKTLILQGYLRNIDDSGLISPREFDEASQILPYFDLAVISDEDHPQANEIAHSWKHASPKTNIIVTQNINGADIILENGVQHVPTEPVSPDKIIDSTGLGDVFSAATAYQLHQSGDIVDAVKVGHVAAREKLLAPAVR